jgi:hypothetical protein
VVCGERAGEGMGGTRDLTSGPVLPAGEQRERERGGAADRWGQAIMRGATRALLGCLGRGRRGGEAGAGATWARNCPAEGGGRENVFPFSFSISLFYFLFLFLFPFYLLFLL